MSRGAQSILCFRVDRINLSFQPELGHLANNA